jgi:transposase
MRFELDCLPSDVDLLHALVRDMADAVEHRDDEIDRLKRIIKQFQKGQFGRRSEQLDPDQMALGLEDLDADQARETEKHSDHLADEADRVADTGERHTKLPDHLERTDVLLDIDGDGCLGCGGGLHPIGETTSEMLDWIPARLRVVRIRRPRYGCRSCGTIYQAPAPERPIAKGRATPGLLAQVLVSKYSDHTPLYRQTQIFARQGVDLSRSTLASWVGGACWWLEPLQVRLAEHVFASTKLFADDTPIGVLDPGRGRTRTGRLWVYVRDDRPWAGADPPAAVYFYSPDRKAERPADHLSRFEGILQVDGYAGFETLANGGRVELAACWAHARRKFYDFHQATGSPIAKEVLSRIATLYAIEKRVRGRSANERQTERQTRSKPVIDTLKPWLEDQLRRVPPRGGLADAIRYTLVRWTALTRFLDDGRIELDNNPVERAIRPIALGRKNHLFAGSDGGAERWATVCSLIETAKLNGVEPYAYLKDVLERMTNGHTMSQIDDLLPWNWKPLESVKQ